MQQGMDGANGNTPANQTRQNGPTMSRQERRRAQRNQQKQAKKARRRN